jgi:DNA-binding response OmpR family regulator
MAARIVIMNDAVELVETMKMLLEEEGYSIATYPAAIVDMNELRMAQPDLLILDWLFGREADGLQVVQAVRLDKELAALPIIVCTAAQRQIQEMQLHLSGKNIRVLYKPFDLDVFLTTVLQALGSVEGAAENGLPVVDEAGDRAAEAVGVAVEAKDGGQQGSGE